MKVWLVTKQRRDWEEYPVGNADVIRGYDSEDQAELERSKLMKQRSAENKYPSFHSITYEIKETEIYLSEYKLVSKKENEQK